MFLQQIENILKLPIPSYQKVWVMLHELRAGVRLFEALSCSEDKASVIFFLKIKINFYCCAYTCMEM
jgi:hypothetical protein